MLVGIECPVEECSLAIGQVIGHESIKSASRMNSAMVLFLHSVEKVNKIVEQGVVVKNAHTPVFPLVNPAKKITMSNIKDDVLECNLS